MNFNYKDEDEERKESRNGIKVKWRGEVIDRKEDKKEYDKGRNREEK